MTAPKIQYLVPSPRGYTLANEAFCKAPMRLSRCESKPDHGPSLSYGQYFEGITDVISKDNYRLLADATRRQLEEDVSLADIGEISIYAEKHGSDYHPARIEVKVRDICVPFVMNVAVTARGKDRLGHEFDVLQHLNSKHGFSCVPQVYFQGEACCSSGSTENGGISLLMFLADWFDGYHEFHLSIDKKNAPHKMVLWDKNTGKRHLSGPEVRQIYSQAAEIMTLYYDIETFEQVFPWHHAAGDFIAKVEDGSVDVKLVSARQYAPMIEPSKEVSVFDALLFFLLNLSVRMRLDRLDGVGNLAWATDDCVDATLDGFLEGLRSKEEEKMVIGGTVNAFLESCRLLAKEDLSGMFHCLVDACDQRAPDMPVIREHLKRHILRFHTAINKAIVPKPAQQAS